MSKLGARIREAREQKKMSREDLANAIGYSAPAIRKVEDGGVTRPNNLSVYAMALDIPLVELESLVEDNNNMKIGITGGPPAGWKASHANVGRKIYFNDSQTRGSTPVLGRAAAGEAGKLVMLYEIAETIPTPSELERVEGGYAVYVNGASMEPRYFSGERVHVNPNRPVSRNDFCVVQIGPDGQAPEEGYIKQFLSLDDEKLRLYQYNPPMELTFDAKAVRAVHLIVGSARG